MNEKRPRPGHDPLHPASDAGEPTDQYAPTQGPAPTTPKTVTPPAEAEPDAAPAVSERVEPQQGERPLRPGRLGDREGEGLLIVVRDADGAVVSINGTWRPSDPSLRLDALRAAFPSDQVTRFSGTRIETGNGDDAEEVSLDVVVTRHGEYERQDGGTLRIVNFTLREEG